MKSKEISVLVIASLILLPFLGGESFAQSNQVLTVTTEKESYASGEPIVILGLVEIRLAEIEAIIQVINPMGNKIDISQIDVESDGSFSKTIKTSIGGLWKEAGTYTIMVNYGKNSTQVEFEYGGSIYAGGQKKIIMAGDHSLEYQIACAEILGITPDTENKSLIIKIKTDCDGELAITLPKEVIDTDENGFLILVDGDETDHNASSVGEFWTLTIPFSYGSEEIEIIGTFVIPEFGTIAALVLVIAISSIILISTKNKQIFIPKM